MHFILRLKVVEIESRVIIPLVVETPKKKAITYQCMRISLDMAHMLIPLLLMLRIANTIKFHRKKVAELRQRGFGWEDNKISETVHLPCFVWFLFFLLITRFERLWKGVGQGQYMETIYPKYQIPAEYWRSYTNPQNICCQILSFLQPASMTEGLNG